MKHGTIILKLNRWTWDNWLLSGLQILIAAFLFYGVYRVSMSIEESPEAIRRRQELEEVLEERRQYLKSLKETSKIPVIDIEGHPELDEMSTGIAKKKATRIALRKNSPRPLSSNAYADIYSRATE